MAAVDIAIADAVVDALGDGVFCLPVSPVRSYAEWDEALEDFEVLHVDVVPVQMGPSVELDSRGDAEYAVEIDVGVRYRFGEIEQRLLTGTVSVEDMDVLKLLVQEIAQFLWTDRLADVNAATLQDVEIKLGWSRKHLRQLRQFFGFVRLKFLATVSLEDEDD